MYVLVVPKSPMVMPGDFRWPGKSNAGASSMLNPCITVTDRHIFGFCIVLNGLTCDLLFLKKKSVVIVIG